MAQYGLVGYPLKHSFSKKFFTEKFLKENIPSEYVNFEIDSIVQLTTIIENNPQLAGLNVTIPYKERVLPYLDELTSEAGEIGAVNTIKITRKQDKIYLTGANTDVWGFENSLKPLLKNHHSNALVLGTGGASKAIQFVLNKLGIEFLTVTTKEPAIDGINYEDLNEHILNECTLIINTTPLGTYPHTESYPDIPYEFVTEKHLLYDLVYNPETTSFLNKGKERGAIIKNGYEMLVLQALKSYEIWNQS